ELLIPNTAASLRRQHDPMVLWLEAAFHANKPWNKMVHEILTASGMQDENGAVTFFVTHESVDQMTDRVARAFLGVQLQCAQCHNHPFTTWKQTEYWGMAAFFTRVRILYSREGGKERSGASETATKGGMLMVPPTAQKLPPAFLAGAPAR